MVTWLRQTLARIQAMFIKSRLDREIGKELDAYIALSTDENIRRGMNSNEARREALSKFGGRDAAIESHRDARGFPFLENLIQDFSYAVRGLVKRPVLLATTTLSIAIGAGLNVAMFSVLHQLLFAADTSTDAPEHLVRIGPELSYPNYEDLRNSDVAAGLAARQASSLIWRNENGTTALSARVVSENFFDVIGVGPLQGQAFGAKNDASGIDAASRAVIAFEFWQRHLGGAPGIIGQSLTLNGWNYVIVGVLPKGFYSTIGPMVSADVYVPVSERVSTGLRERAVPQFDLIGRLRDGMTRGQTLAAARTVAQQLESRYPDSNRGLARAITVSPITGVIVLDSAPVRRTVFAASGIVYAIAGLVLLVACLNVASILVARALEREREISIRTALGATRGRILQQFLAESCVIATLGCVGGAVLWVLGTNVIPKMQAIVNAGINIIPVPLPFMYCIALTTVVTICCGLLPAISANQKAPGFALKTTRGTAGIRRWTVGRSLVAGQVAVCFVLLTGAFVLLVSFLRQKITDPGFDVAHTVSIQMILPTTFQPGQALPRSFSGLRSMVESMPGVEGVTSMRFKPLAFLPVSTRVHRLQTNSEDSFTAGLHPVGPRYFATMAIPLRRGRDFDDEDLRFASAAETPVIINRTLVQRYFTNADPLGERLVIDEPNGIQKGRVLRIVGVSEDTKLRSLNEEPLPVLYLPETSRLLIVRVAGSADAAVNGLERIFADREPGAVITIKPMSDSLTVALRPARMGFAVFIAMGGLGVVLAMIGLYGTVRYTVNRRKFEIGVRMALGARPWSVMRMILTDAVRMVGVGSAIGVLLSLALIAVLRPLLAAGQSSISPIALLCVFAALLVPAVLVSLGPARSATTVDPITALRHE